MNLHQHKAKWKKVQYKHAIITLQSKATKFKEEGEKDAGHQETEMQMHNQLNAVPCPDEDLHKWPTDSCT